MQELRCPNCGEVFQVDESGYDQIARQVRDQEFSKEIERREKELEANRDRELALIRMQEEKEYAAGLTKKEAEIAAKEQLIAELQAKLEAGETAKSLAVREAVEKKNQELSGEARAHAEILMKRMPSWLPETAGSQNCRLSWMPATPQSSLPLRRPLNRKMRN